MSLILAGSVAIATLDSLNKPRFDEITSRLDTIIELLREKSMSSTADLTWAWTCEWAVHLYVTENNRLTE